MRRPLLALLVVTLIAVAGAAWAVWDTEQANLATTTTPGPMFPELTQPGTVVGSIEVMAPGYTLALEHRGDAWIAKSNGGYPVRVGLADGLIKQIASLNRREAKTRNPAWYGRIDVADAGAKDSAAKLVRLAGSGIEPVSVLVGKRASSVGADPIGATFVRRPGDEQAWLAEGLVQIPDGLSDWFEQLVHVPGPQVSEVTILEGDAEVFDARKEDGATSYTVLKVDPRYAEPGEVGDDDRIKGMETGIVSVALVDVRPADTVTFAADARTVRFRTGDGLVVEARLGEADGKVWVAYSASAAEGSEEAETAAAINSRCKGWAFRVADHKVAALQTPIGDLLTSEAPQPKKEQGPPAGNFLTPEQMQSIPGFGPAQ